MPPDEVPVRYWGAGGRLHGSVVGGRARSGYGEEGSLELGSDGGKSTVHDLTYESQIENGVVFRLCWYRKRAGNAVERGMAVVETGRSGRRILHTNNGRKRPHDTPTA